MFDVDIGMSNFPFVTVARFWVARGVSTLSLKFPENVPAILVAVIDVMVIVTVSALYRAKSPVVMFLFRVRSHVHDVYVPEWTYVPVCGGKRNANEIFAFSSSASFFEYKMNIPNFSPGPCRGRTNPAFSCCSTWSTPFPVTGAPSIVADQLASMSGDEVEAAGDGSLDPASELESFFAAQAKRARAVSDSTVALHVFVI